MRELTQKRVWFAEPLISATADEVRRLIAQAKAWAESLGKPVALWLSDRQDAFVTGIAAEFPDVPHRYCNNHFLRDLAKPMLEIDRHTKVQMPQKVRGLRKIEQAVLGATVAQGRGGRGRRRGPSHGHGHRGASGPAPAGGRPGRYRGAGLLLLTVRGILNDDQGGPLQPPGCGWPRLWMRSANRSNGIWTRKRVRRGSAGPPGRLHRPRPRRSSDRTRDDSRLRQGHPEVAATLGSAGEAARTVRRSSRS